MDKKTRAFVLSVLLATSLLQLVAAIVPGQSARQVVKVRTKAVSMYVRVRGTVDFGYVDLDSTVCSDYGDVIVQMPGSGRLTVRITDLDTATYGEQLNYNDLHGAIKELWIQEMSDDTTRDPTDVTLIADGSVPGVLPQELDVSKRVSYEICIKTGSEPDKYDSIELTYELS
ncbi:MAG: hypothetical protein J7K98_02165 [Candidatus Aenigmarchaeota archaeon]|nr:hypothetical protein [Candidatus Aenigmarchaeota archaeon]